MTHTLQITRLLQRREVDAPAFDDCLTVEAAVVDGLVAPVVALPLPGRRLFSLLRRFLRLLGGGCLRLALLRLLLRGGLLVLGRIDLVRGE